MKYHDNEVEIRTDGFRLFQDAYGNCGHFTIEDSSVTDGQDPNGNISPGKTINVNKDGVMCLRVGRKGSGKVAHWWKEHVPDDHNTFNKSPKDLNFAVKGTLVLNIDSGTIGGRKVVTYPDVCMAQGHVAAQNNWWFGGTTRCYLNTDTDSLQSLVKCFGYYEESSVPMMVRTHVNRTELGASVNSYTFSLLKAEDVSCASWMGRLSGETRLKDIMMPASHDSGMSELHHIEFISSLNKGAIQTQNNSIYEQLMNGVRYFDLRPDYDHKELVTYHRSGGHGAGGQSFHNVFIQARDFLREHTSETFIFKISHYRDFHKDHKPEDIFHRFLQFVKSFDDIIYHSDTPKKLHEIPLKELRGKIVMVYEMINGAGPDPSKGIFMYTDVKNERIESLADNQLVVYDDYSNTPQYGKMKEDQLQKWERNGGQSATKLFLLSWTLTLDTFTIITGHTIEGLAEEANKYLAEILADGINQKKYAKPNMVYLDYIDSRLCKEIISYNFK